MKRDKKVPIRNVKVITGSPQAIISLHADFREVTPKPGGKTLTQRFNEAYDEEARQEDEVFCETLKLYYRNRYNVTD